MSNEIQEYNDSQEPVFQEICNILKQELNKGLPNAEKKIWHRHPVWFLEGNPIVGYSKLKSGIRLMFWSGVSFEEKNLKPGSGKFKDASITYTSPNEIKTKDLQRWLQKSQEIQWDYKNIIKREGKLERVK